MLPPSSSSSSSPSPSTSPSTSTLDLLLSQFAENLTGLKGDDRRAYEDLEFYSRYVIGWGNPDYRENSRFLKRIYEALQYSPDNQFLILGPRGSAKSSAVTITYTTWMIGRNPSIRILLAFASMEAQGRAFARQIDQILTANERYIRIFGRLKPDRPEKWDATEKIVVRPEPPGGLKDPTISIVGAGSHVPSRRADIVIGDDLVTQENAYSPALRAQLSAFVKQSLLPILVPGGRAIFVGSRWDPRDLYAELADDWGLTFPPPVPIDTAKLAALSNKQIEEDKGEPRTP
jgi:hypothetical protein